MRTQNAKKLIIITLILACDAGLLCIRPVYAGEVTYEFYGLDQDGSITWGEFWINAGRVSTNWNATPDDAIFVIGSTYYEQLMMPQPQTWYRYFFLMRGYVGFDLSSLPPDVSASSATLSLYGEGSFIAGDDFDVKVYSGWWGPTLEAADWPSWSMEPLDFFGSMNTSSFINGSYNNILLTGGTITASKLSYLALIASLETGGPADTTWAWGNYNVTFYSTNETGTDKDPKIAVTYQTYPIDGYVRRPDGTGISGVTVTITGGWMATPGTPASGPIVLTTGNDSQGNPGYYETPFEVLEGTYIITASNP